VPHYADGTEAKNGDIVKGKPYNTAYEVTGVVVGVIPDSDACNVRVAFTKPGVPFTREGRKFHITEYDPSGEGQTVEVEVDYGETRAFSKIA
jgi:hypothetical protein